MKIENHKNCGVTKTIKVIGSKWSMLLLHNLFDGKKRFGELQKTLVGISPKTLSQRLKDLEREKLITKKIYPVIPLHVEYTLTPKGRSLNEVFRKMADWGDKTT